MSVMSHIVVISVAWWLIFFMLLPIGVRTAEEAGEEREEGTAESAPVNPNLKWKVLGATLGALIFWGLFWFVMNSGWISLGIDRA